MGILKTCVLFLRAMLIPEVRLVFENLALREQVAVFKRSVRRSKLRPRDQVFWVWLLAELAIVPGLRPGEKRSSGGITSVSNCIEPGNPGSANLDAKQMIQVLDSKTRTELLVGTPGWASELELQFALGSMGRIPPAGKSSQGGHWKRVTLMTQGRGWRRTRPLEGRRPLEAICEHLRRSGVMTPGPRKIEGFLGGFGGHYQDAVRNPKSLSPRHLTTFCVNVGRVLVILHPHDTCLDLAQKLFWGRFGRTVGRHGYLPSNVVVEGLFYLKPSLPLRVPRGLVRS